MKRMTAPKPVDRAVSAQDVSAALRALDSARNAEAKRLRAEGWTVKVGSNAALMSRGGIGSGHPHIELWSTVYTISATRA